MSYPVNPWIRTFGLASTSALQLVCLPHAGGAASYFGPMAREFAPHVEVLAIQYPGRQDRYRERLIDSIEELADHVVDALVPHLYRPTSLFGHSMGAAVAFEVATRLEARGHQVSALFVSGCGAPSLSRGSHKHELSDAELVGELVRLGATDPAIMADDELRQFLLPAVRADYRAIETYRHREGNVINCPVVALFGSSDPYVNAAKVGAWHQHARGDFELHELPGGHFFIDQQRDRVLEIMQGRLA